MMELAQLFQDMEAAVITQEPAIQNTEEKTENTVVNLDQGNKHLDGAVVKARSARRKKWICFWIVGESIYAIPPNAMRGGYLMLPSTHRHYHWGRCRSWCGSDGRRNQKDYWNLIAMSLDFTHPSVQSHGAPNLSFSSTTIGLQASSELDARSCSSRMRLQTARRTSWMAALLIIIFRLHFKKPRALLLLLTLAYVRYCRIEECGNPRRTLSNQQTASYSMIICPPRNSRIGP